MKNASIVILCALQLAVCNNVRVHGMAGELTHPSIAWAADDAPMRQRIMAILNEKNSKFLGGRFVNAASTLEYGGTTEALSRMVAKLAECEGVRVQVTFVRAQSDLAWTVNHNAWADPLYFGIQVNLAAKTINLEHLDLPAFTKTSGKPSASGTAARR
jgi:hypothetical protein